MRCTRTAALAASGLMALAAGCQHAPPRPLDFHETAAALAARDVTVAPVHAYAQVLAAAQGTTPAVFDPADGLSLAEAEAVALWFNPDLRIARLQADQARAVAGAAGRWDDPELGGELGQKAVDGAPGGFLRNAGGVARDWITAGSLSITIPLSGRPAAERRLGQAEYRVASLRALEAEWGTLAHVRNAWAMWSAAAERVKLLDEHLAMLGQFADTAQSLADAGEATPSSARIFGIERMRRQAERARATAAEAESHAALLQLLGLVPDAPVQLLPNLTSVPADTAADVDAEHHPKLLRLKAEYQAAEDRLRLELRKQYPDLTLSPTYADEQDETSLRVGLGIPLPTWNANRQGIAEALGAREVARAQAEAGYQQLLAEAAQARAARAGCATQRQQLVESVVPAIDAQMKEALALLKVGEVDIVLLHESLSQALAVKEELLDAALAEALAASRLAAATAHDERIPTPTESNDDNH